MDGMTFDELVERFALGQAFVRETTKEGNTKLFFEDGGSAELTSQEVKIVLSQIDELEQILGQVEGLEETEEEEDNS